MQIDKRLLRKLVRPLKGHVSLGISEYIKELGRLDVSILEDDHSHVNSVVLEHLKYLIANGELRNDRNSTSLKDFGIYIGADNTFAVSTAFTIAHSKQSKLPGFLWKVLKYAIIPIIVALLTAFLTLKLHLK